MVTNKQLLQKHDFRRAFAYSHPDMIICGRRWAPLTVSTWQHLITSKNPFAGAGEITESAVMEFLLLHYRGGLPKWLITPWCMWWVSRRGRDEVEADILDAITVQREDDAIPQSPDSEDEMTEDYMTQAAYIITSMVASGYSRQEISDMPLGQYYQERRAIWQAKGVKSEARVDAEKKMDRWTAAGEWFDAWLTKQRQ